MTEQDIRQLLAALARASSYRDADTHLALSRTLPLCTGHHHSDGLDGNLGVILYRSPTGVTLGERWIAPSKKIRKRVRDAAVQAGDTLLHYCTNGTIQSCSAQAPNQTLPAPLTPTNRDHANDSEHVLLNALRFHLNQRGLTHGTVHLLTERIPCSSCTDVIMKFARAFPSIGISVGYLTDYVNKAIRWSHVDFFRQWATSRLPEISLVKLEQIEKDAWKVIKLTSATPLLGCVPEYFAPGAPRFGLVNGKPGITQWREEDYHQLRDALRILPSR